MFTIILANILIVLKAWLANPATWASAIGFLATLPKIIETIKTAKGANFWDKAMEVAKIEAFKVAYMNLTDEEKRKRVVDAVFAVFPAEAQKYKFIVDEIVEIAYLAYVKPNLKTNTPMNSLNSPICDAGGNCKN